MWILLMVFVTFLVFLLSNAIFETPIAFVFSFVFFGAWLLFNIRSSRSGLIKSNARVYFIHRARGTSHEEALQKVVQSRYPNSLVEQEKIRKTFLTASSVLSEIDQLKSLIYTIYCHESGIPPTTTSQAKMCELVDSICDSMNYRYGLLDVREGQRPHPIPRGRRGAHGAQKGQGPSTMPKGQQKTHSAQQGNKSAIAHVLLTAAEEGNSDVVEACLENDADINAKDEQGQTPLMLAAENGHAKIVNYLIRLGAELDLTDDSQSTALKHARGLHDNIVDLLKSAGAKDGRTPLMEAAEKGDTESASILLENGADVNAKDVDGETSLHLAAWRGHAELVRLLIDAGADLNTELYGSDITALEMAKWEEEYDVIELLKEAGAKE